MQPLHRRVLFGALAALCAAYVALDASMGKPSNYPFFHKFFGDDWDVARNTSYLIGTLGAAFFGFLAVNIKNGNGHPPVS